MICILSDFSIVILGQKTCIFPNFCIIHAEVFLFPMQKTGFTLIELLVVISIIAILSIMSYAPYNHYANISRVKFSAQKIEQVVNEAKSNVLA